MPERGTITGLRIPSCGVRLLDTEPRATSSLLGERSPAPGLTGGNHAGRVSSVSSSVPPRVDGRFYAGLLYGLAFTLPFWLLVVYAAVRGVW